MTWQRWVIFGLALAVTNCSLADLSTASTNSLDRYKSIVERPPFRKSSSGVAPTAQTSVQGLLLTGIYVDNSIRKAWIRDTRTQQSYGVQVGETVLDFRVDKIDPENQSVVLTRGVDAQSLTFPKTPAAPSPVPAPAAGFQPRPLMRLPGHSPQPVTPPPPAPATAVTTPVPSGGVPVVSPQTSTGAVSRASLRRRIMRQNLNQANPQPPAEVPADEGAKDAKDGEQAAEEAPAQQ